MYLYNTSSSEIQGDPPMLFEQWTLSEIYHSKNVSEILEIHSTTHIKC